jgi:hypothetical protein
MTIVARVENGNRRIILLQHSRSLKYEFVLRWSSQGRFEV